MAAQQGLCGFGVPNLEAPFQTKTAVTVDELGRDFQ
jgi:hypothetical protein